MKKLTFFFFMLFSTTLLLAQEKFELNPLVKIGVYAPGKSNNSPYFPENSLSVGGGLSLRYHLFEKTYISLGTEVNYLSPDMIDFQNNPLDVKWHSINFPIGLEQTVLNNGFITGGITLARQLSGYWNDDRTSYRNQKIPEYNWQVGIGWNLNKVKISLNYSKGFETVEKKIKIDSNNSFDVDVMHQELYLRIEYSLWKF
jgi:hypothetical protein